MIIWAHLISMLLALPIKITLCFPKLLHKFQQFDSYSTKDFLKISQSGTEL